MTASACKQHFCQLVSDSQSVRDTMSARLDATGLIACGVNLVQYSKGAGIMQAGKWLQGHVCFLTYLSCQCTQLYSLVLLTLPQMEQSRGTRNKAPAEHVNKWQRGKTKLAAVELTAQQC